MNKYQLLNFNENENWLASRKSSICDHRSKYNINKIFKKIIECNCLRILCRNKVSRDYILLL